MKNPFLNLPLILASASPRRQDLLSQAGFVFQIKPVFIDESWQTDECAKDYIERMVLQKAKAATVELQEECLLLTADTIGVLADGSVLTKPKNKSDAYRMWNQLSDNHHEIWTAVCVSHIHHGKIIHQKQICQSTQVSFKFLSDEMKDSYWKTGEPVDKAGAYAIQGGAASWVKEINGSYTNVVGLPLAQTVDLIEDMQKLIYKA